MRFYSKIVFLCNCCFIAFVVLRHFEKLADIKGSKEALIPLPALQGMLVTLGMAAIILNFIFVILAGIFTLLKKDHHVAKWLVWANTVLLLLQFIYFNLY